MDVGASTSPFTSATHHYGVAAAAQGRYPAHGDHGAVMPDVVHMDANLGRSNTAERGPRNPRALQHVGTSPAERASPEWSDWLGEQTCTPLLKTEPTSLDQLVSIIQDADAKKQHLRAVGSGHSTSDITRTDGAVLVDPHRMAALVDVDKTILAQQGSNNGSLIRVQSGILIKDLNQQLDGRGLALTHMGAHDGQTISGAMNTGTHGSGVPWGPMASMLRSIVMVTENGTVLQVEPAGGATDALKFPGKLPEAPSVPVTLVQDDDWFHAVQVSMGCMGVVYSYMIAVGAAFHVSENRTSTMWEDIKGQFTPENFNPLPAALADWDRYALEVSPYPSDGDGGKKHPCVKTESKSAGNTPTRGARNDFWGRIVEDLGILLTNSVLDDVLDAFPKLTPTAVNTAMDRLNTADAPYVDASYKVFRALDTELQLRAHALELHFDARNMVATIDRLMDTFETIADRKKLYVAGPISIRFIAASDALLAPSAGRLTATAELTNIVGIDEGVELLQEVKSAMSSYDPSIRVHWGLDLDTITAQDVQTWYGTNMDRWLNVYRQLNVNGMFNNDFTDRIGISVGK